MRVAISLICLWIGVAASTHFPGDAEGQQLLLQETMGAILKFKEEYDANPQLHQTPVWDTVPDVIARYGYPVETYDNITTEDEYILTAHRIPYGLACGAGVPRVGEQVKRVVWLQHGLMGDSSNWVITGNMSRGLAFELADACYDVWMGNFRGNTYSKNHLTLNPNSTEYWNFSWHELGMYDVPANINFALATTGVEQLYYIGFFITMTERPEFNDKVKLFSALAPVTYMSNTRSIVVRLALSLLPIAEGWNYTQILNIETTRGLASSLCKKGAPTQPLCALILFLIGGYNQEQLDMEYLPAILTHSPAGCSSKAFIHYGQSITNLGHFRQFDYRNGTVPKSYDLSKMTVPTAIYYGDNDYLADKSDVLMSLKSFRNGTIVRKHRIEDDFCTHLDFLWAKDQHRLINKPIMDFMEEFTNPKETTTKSPGGVGVVTASWISIALLYCVTIYSVNNMK